MKYRGNKRSFEELRVYENNKAAMYRRDNWHCRCCNRSDTLTPHHIVFQSQGGTDDLDNLVTLCVKCHDDVHEGRLKIEVKEVCSKFEGSYTLKFTRGEGGKP
jgi:5-methylcytosine-specific restriction endonuclease McrA